MLLLQKSRNQACSARVWGREPRGLRSDMCSMDLLLLAGLHAAAVLLLHAAAVLLHGVPVDARIRVREQDAGEVQVVAQRADQDLRVLLLEHARVDGQDCEVHEFFDDAVAVAQRVHGLEDPGALLIDAVHDHGPDCDRLVDGDEGLQDAPRLLGLVNHVREAGLRHGLGDGLRHLPAELPLEGVLHGLHGLLLAEELEEDHVAADVRLHEGAQRAHHLEVEGELVRDFLLVVARVERADKLDDHHHTQQPQELEDPTQADEQHLVGERGRGHDAHGNDDGDGVTEEPEDHADEVQRVPAIGEVLAALHRQLHDQLSHVYHLEGAVDNDVGHHIRTLRARIGEDQHRVDQDHGYDEPLEGDRGCHIPAEVDAARVLHGGHQVAGDADHFHGLAARDLLQGLGFIDVEGL
mmetsp:Transcript_81084/g.208734  ORF Transcript_81084/g.208734 Transcript_81084/m.208734 type:complete len:409 (+) Transcript_81084:294-1520(+)